MILTLRPEESGTNYAYRKRKYEIKQVLSLVLRHQPELIEIALDEQGWVSVAELRKKAAAYGKPFSMETLEFVVDTNSKKRFAFNGDKTKIRESQGHSIGIDLGYEPQSPPEILYHGTATHIVEAILKTGLKNRSEPMCIWAQIGKQRLR